MELKPGPWELQTKNPLESLRGESSEESTDPSLWMENGDRSAQEIESILGYADIVRFFKWKRISWLGHVQRMSDHRTPKNIMNEEIYGRKKRGRPIKCLVTDLGGGRPQEDEHPR